MTDVTYVTHISARVREKRKRSEYPKVYRGGVGPPPLYCHFQHLRGICCHTSVTSVTGAGLRYPDLVFRYAVLSCFVPHGASQVTTPGNSETCERFFASEDSSPPARGHYEFF